MATGTLAVPQQRVFRVFISYASEDVAIATAVAACFKTALPDFFAEVNFDKEFLEPGSPFKSQIESKLQQTDVFIIVYTGAEKRSHGYTGWEVGFFDHIMRTDPGRRKKISLYLFDPPAITASEQGISLGLSTEQLRLTPPEFESTLSVLPEESLCKEIASWQDEVGKNIEQSGFTRPQRKPEQEPAKCVLNLKLAIFQYLKGTIENTVKPQKQITIRVKGSALEQSSESLPPESELRPLGATSTGGSMKIFGLADDAITWKRFVELTASQPFAESWQDAITRVVLSSFPDRVDVDNSQVILGIDGTTGYRVILTTATKFYDDCREYNLYFVEMLQRTDYGDAETTQLLKGLELVCRFRSLFLETGSEFLGENVLMTSAHQLPQLASRLLKELNLLHRDSQEAGLDKPGKWMQFIEFENFKTIAAAYRPAESKLRNIIPKIIALSSQPELLEPQGKEMSEVLLTMQMKVRPLNTLLLREMAAKLSKIAEHQDQASSGAEMKQADEVHQ
jgi:TIR domain